MAEPMVVEQSTVEDQWVATERSDAAESALLREYHYHVLRAEELRVFLQQHGIGLGGWAD